MSERAIERIIAAATDSRGIAAAPQLALAEAWPAASFGLDRCDAYSAADAARQRAILERCATDRLQEAWYIERLGIVYGAKMTLLAESDDERTLYALICGEEAAHFRLIASLVPRPEGESEFTALLDRIVAEASKPALVFLVQVVLEGWGMHYYARLERECLAADVRDAFSRILRDEARHHGSGVVLVRDLAGDPRALGEIEGYLRQLLAMVRSGPQSVVAALEPRSEEDARALFVALGDGKTRADLALLRRLIELPHLHGLAANLEADALFEPMTADEMASLHAAGLNVAR